MAERSGIEPAPPCGGVLFSKQDEARQPLSLQILVSEGRLALPRVAPPASETGASANFATRTCLWWRYGELHPGFQHAMLTSSCWTISPSWWNHGELHPNFYVANVASSYWTMAPNPETCCHCTTATPRGGGRESDPGLLLSWCGRRDLNPQPPDWKSGALRWSYYRKIYDVLTHLLKLFLAH